MAHHRRISRRELLSRGATGIALAGVAGGSLIPVRAGESPVPERPAAIRVFSTGIRQGRRIVAGPDGTILVAANRSVLQFDSRGRKLQSLNLSRPVRGVAAAGDGSLFVVFLTHIESISADGTKRVQWEAPAEKCGLCDIALGGENVFVADAVQGVVWKFDPNGRRLQAIRGARGLFTSPAEHFSITTDEDTLYVANAGRHRVETFTFDGMHTGSWGRRSRSVEGFSGCCNPVGLALLPDGRVVTAERGLSRVKVYDSSGKMLSVLARPEQFVQNTELSQSDDAGCHAGGMALAVDAQHRVLVLDRVTGDIHLIG